MRLACLFSMILYCGILNISAQTDNDKTSVPLENISAQITKISKSLDDLNKRLTIFSETFTSNQGLRLSEKQQQLLFAFEILNRAEVRYSTLLLLKTQLAERESTTKRKIALIDDNLRSENIDRTLNGTLDAETVRNNRRRALQTERNDLSQLLSELQTSLRETNSEIDASRIFLRRIRQQILPNAEKELSN